MYHQHIQYEVKEFTIQPLQQQVNSGKERFIRSVFTVTETGERLLIILAKEHMLVVNLNKDTSTAHELPDELQELSLPTIVLRGPNKVVIFAGQSYDGFPNLLWEFNIVSTSFKELCPCDDVWPTGRYGHSAVYRSDSMFVYGGWVDDKYLNDFWEFDFLSDKWKLLESPTIVPGLFGHISVLRKNCDQQDSMVVCGGMMDNSSNFSQSLLEYNFEHKTWQTLKQDGWVPRGRNWHEAQLTSNDCLLMFAGDLYIDQKETAANDMSLYCFSTHKWTQLTASTQWMPVFAAASAYDYTTRKLFLLWGEDELERVHPCYEFQLPQLVTQPSEMCLLSPDQSELTKDINALYGDKIMADFTLCSQDAKVFPVHKLVLAMRSPYFRQFYNTNFAESQCNSLKLEFFDAETVELLLRYIYGFKVTVPNLQLLINLTTAANMLMLNGLEKQCVQQLVERVNKENAMVLKHLATTLSDGKQLSEKVKQVLQ